MIGNELKAYDGLTPRQQLNLFRNLYYNDGNATEYGIIANAINDFFAADVVPKSEVVNILDELMKEAREISTRYEKSANETSVYDYARIEYRGCQMGALLVLFKIAELKKKYTEGDNDG